MLTKLVAAVSCICCVSTVCCEEKRIRFQLQRGVREESYRVTSGIGVADVDLKRCSYSLQLAVHVMTINKI